MSKSPVNSWTCDSLLQGPSHSLSTSITFALGYKVHSASSQLTRSPGAPHASPPADVWPIIISWDKAQPLFLWILELNWIMNVAFYCVTIKLTMSVQALDCVTFNFTLLEESWHNICTGLFDAFFQFASLFSSKLHFFLSIQVLSCVGEHGGSE